MNNAKIDEKEIIDPNYTLLAEACRPSGIGPLLDLYGEYTKVTYEEPGIFEVFGVTLAGDKRDLADILPQKTLDDYSEWMNDQVLYCLN